MYKVKSFYNLDALVLQKELEQWIEIERHIYIISINIWSNQGCNYALIVYREEQFNL